MVPLADTMLLALLEQALVVRDAILAVDEAAGKRLISILRGKFGDAEPLDG